MTVFMCGAECREIAVDGSRDTICITAGSTTDSLTGRLWNAYQDCQRDPLACFLSCLQHSYVLHMQTAHVMTLPIACNHAQCLRRR